MSGRRKKNPEDSSSFGRRKERIELTSSSFLLLDLCASNSHPLDFILC